MVRGCQTCLRVMKDPSSEGLDLNSVSSGSDTIPLEEKLADCVPELILDSVQNAVLCHPCVESLTLAYQFKQRCLEAQEKIYGFLQQVPDSTQTDIGNIAVYYQRLEMIEHGGDPSIDDPSNINVKCAEMPYSCKWCPFSCLDKCVMRQHRILHRNKAPPYKCDQCYFIFPTAVLLLDHLASHSNERPYACTLCDFESSSHKKLKKHGWVHRKAFQCNICWKRFAQRNELDAHVEIHNCELATRPFQCGLCEFKCGTLQTINSHSVNSHQNMYNCKTCKVKCRTQLGLRQHTARVHKEPAVINVYDRQHEGVNRVDNASDARERISMLYSDDFLDLQEDWELNVNNRTNIEVITHMNVQGSSPTVLPSVPMLTSPAKSTLLGAEVSLLECLAVQAGGKPDSNVAPSTSGVKKVKKKYHRNRKRVARTRIFFGPNSFVRVKTSQLTATGNLVAAAASREWKVPKPDLNQTPPIECCVLGKNV